MKMKSILSKKEIKQLLSEIEETKQSRISNLLAKLRKDVCDFEKVFDEINYIRAHFKLDETKKDTERQKVQLLELIQDLNTLNSRIEADVQAVQNYLKKKIKLNSKSINESNGNLNDLLTSYEITIARYKNYLDRYKEKPSKLLDKAFLAFTSSMKNLDLVILDFNSQSSLKLIQPSKDSKIVKEIVQYGFQIIPERDWKQLVKFR